MTQPGFFCPSSHTPRNVGISPDFLCLLLSRLNLRFLHADHLCDTSHNDCETCCPRNIPTPFSVAQPLNFTLATTSHSTCISTRLSTSATSVTESNLFRTTTITTSPVVGPHTRLAKKPTLTTNHQTLSNNHVFLHSCWGQPRQVSLSYFTLQVSLTMDLSPCFAGLRCPCFFLTSISIN